MASSRRSNPTSKRSAAASTRSSSSTPRDRSSRLRETVRDGYTVLVDAVTSRRMAGIRQVGTKPELVVRKLITSLGYRYRVNNRDLPGSPDLANRSRRWAVFVHGCYWHRHPNCRLATTPKRNRDFWQAKFERNVERDTQAAEALRERGFDVITVWECEARDERRLVERLRQWFASRHTSAACRPPRGPKQD